MRETTLQTFGGSTVFTAKNVDIFTTETHRGRERDFTTWTRERNGVNLTLTLQHQLVIRQGWRHVTRKIYIKHD